MYKFLVLLIFVITLPILVVGFLFTACAYAFQIGAACFDGLVEKAQP